MFMKIKIITVGTPQLSFAKEGIKEYTKRLSRFANIEVNHIKEGRDTNKKITQAVGNYRCLLLDEKGIEYSSREFASFLDKQKNQSNNLAIVIGGPDGHPEIMQDLSQEMMSLSRLTFPHDVATMIVLEALYRSHAILAGHPYHRD